MGIGRYGQLLDAAVGELDPAVAAVGEPQVVLVAPVPSGAAEARTAGRPARPARRPPRRQWPPAEPAPAEPQPLPRRRDSPARRRRYRHGPQLRPSFRGPPRRGRRRTLRPRAHDAEVSPVVAPVIKARPVPVNERQKHPSCPMPAHRQPGADGMDKTTPLEAVRPRSLRMNHGIGDRWHVPRTRLGACPAGKPLARQGTAGCSSRPAHVWPTTSCGRRRHGFLRGCFSPA